MIKKTKDYSLFKLSKRNRPIKQVKVDNLVKSIKKVNLLDSYPILVNEKYEVMDGQHRLKAAEKLGLEVYYSLKKEAVDEVMILTNNNQNKWQISVYLNFFADNENYKKFKEYLTKYPFVPMSSLMYIIGPSTITGGSTNKAFREGTFLVENEEEGREILEALREIEPYLHDGVSTNRQFYKAFRRVFEHPDFDAERLIERFKVSGRRLHMFANIKEYIRGIEDIYNYHMGKQTRLY